MSQQKFIEITSFSLEDTNDLFNEMCPAVLNMTPLEVKKKILRLTGSDKALNDYKVGLNDLLNTMSIYDIAFALRIMYIDGKFSEKKKIVPDFSPGPVDSHTNLMEKQEQEISNPELKELAKEAMQVKPIVVEEKKIDPGDIPDFK